MEDRIGESYFPASAGRTSNTPTTSTISPHPSPHPSAFHPHEQSPPYHHKYFDYFSFCNCVGPNQERRKILQSFRLSNISYFNPKTREFYYHSVPDERIHDSVREGFIFLPRKPPPTQESGPEGSGSPSSHPPFHYYSGPRNHGAKYFGPSSMESGIAEVSFVILAFILWLYSFYRLYSVWQNTLNFSEASIQGPQGWDFLVNWILERVHLKRIKSITKGRKCEPYTMEEGINIELDHIPSGHPPPVDIDGTFSNIISESMDETHSYLPVLNNFQRTDSGSLCQSDEYKFEHKCYNQSIV